MFITSTYVRKSHHHMTSGRHLKGTEKQQAQPLTVEVVTVEDEDCGQVDLLGGHIEMSRQNAVGFSMGFSGII